MQKSVQFSVILFLALSKRLPGHESNPCTALAAIPGYWVSCPTLFSLLLLCGANPSLETGSKSLMTEHLPSFVDHPQNPARSLAPAPAPQLRAVRRRSPSSPVLGAAMRRQRRQLQLQPHQGLPQGSLPHPPSLAAPHRDVMPTPGR